MMTTLYAVAGLLIPVGVILFAAILLLGQALIKRLREAHPDTYTQLGAPRLFGAREAGLALRSFIFSRADRELHDERLSHIVGASLATFYAFMVCTAYVLACLIAMSLGVHGL